jgi:hypothetical protein
VEPIDIDLESFFSGARKYKQILSIIVASLTIFSYIMAIYAFDSPSSGLRWNSDSYIPESSYSRGDTVNIYGSIEEAQRYLYFGQYFSFTSDVDVRWIVIVKGPNNEPIHIETDLLTMFSGDLDLDLVNFALPSNAATGTYTVRVFVWSDWLPGGETMTYQVSERTFEVTP